MHVLVLYLPIPIFWALYDQQVRLGREINVFDLIPTYWVIGFTVVVSSHQNGRKFGFHGCQAGSNWNHQSFVNYSHHSHFQ